MRNRYGVGAVGRKVHISELDLKLEPKDALELAAWLCAASAPLTRGGLDEFLKLLAEAGEGTELGGAALAALEEDDKS